MRFCGKCGAEQVPQITLRPGRYRDAVARATGMELEGGMADNCPECARMLADVCRLNYQLGLAHGSHTLLRTAARELLEAVAAWGPMEGLERHLTVLSEALAATDPDEPPPRP